MTPKVKIFSLDHPRAVKKCRKCVLEVGCVKEGAGLDHECTEFFFLRTREGERGGGGVFRNTIYNYYPDASK